jgi:hypothetical protein
MKINNLIEDLIKTNLRNEVEMRYTEHGRYVTKHDEVLHAVIFSLWGPRDNMSQTTFCGGSLAATSDFVKNDS